jgi:hypothetical protein
MTEQKITDAHPAALLFPMMSTDELQKLADDIKENGLLEPIVLLDDLILDGRNRLKACGMAGVPPRYDQVALNGNSPTLYVVSKNLHRRHLSIGQRAAIGAEMKLLLRDEMLKRQQEGGRTGAAHRWLPANLPEAIPTHESNDIRGESRSVAAKAMGVGGRTIQTAAAVLTKDRETFERLKSGEIGLGEAHRKASEKVSQEQSSTKKHRALPAPGKQRRTALEKAETARMVKGLSRIHGLCRGLSSLKMQLLILTADERKAWMKSCSESAQALYNFSRKVKGAS